MSTLLVTCSFTILAVVASYEKNCPDAALEWQPVTWFVVYSSAVLVLVVVVVTCVRRRDRINSKVLLGVDMVERGVLHGEQAVTPCEWLSRCWPWSPAPTRSPLLGHLRMGLTRSTQPLLRYQLLEKRHVHLVRGALCVLRTDLKELQELAEKEMTLALRESRGSGDQRRKSSYGSQFGSVSGSLISQFRSVSSSTMSQSGTVKPVELADQPQPDTGEPAGSSDQRVSWSPSTEDVTAEAEFVGEGVPTDPAITGDSTQSQDKVSSTNFALDVKTLEKRGVESVTTSPSETVDIRGRDDSQPTVTLEEAITQSSDHVTPFKNVVKAKSYIDIHGEVDKNPKPTVLLGGTQIKRDLSPLRKTQSATDLEQTSDSDVLVEIHGSSEDFKPYLPPHKHTQEHDTVLTDNIVLDRQFKTFTYISTPNGDPVSAPLQKEISTATINSVTQSPSVYISVLDNDAAKLPRDTLRKKETEESRLFKPVSGSYVSNVGDISTRVSSCFLHSVTPLSQQECLKLNKTNISKSELYISLHPEKENSVLHPQYWQQTEYKVTPASLITTNNTFFRSSKTATERQNTESTGRSVADEEEPGLQTTWDLLHRFPYHTNMLQMPRIGTRSKLNPVSKSHSGFNQSDGLSTYLSCKGDEVLTNKQQKSCSMEGKTFDSKRKCSRVDQHTSTIVDKPSYSRSECSPASESEIATEQQHSLPATMTDDGEHHKLGGWRITISRHLAGSSKEHTKIPDHRQNHH